MENEKEEHSLVLDQIHDIASKALGENDIPLIVEKALDEIVSLARYKFRVLNDKNK